MNEIVIGTKKVGPAYPPYFIADIAANHDGDLHRAYKLIELAKEAGADAAKFQNFKAEKIVSKASFDSLGGLSHQSRWKKSVFEVYQDATVPDDWTAKLKEKCNRTGIEYMTSPYDYSSVEWAAPFVNCFKIGSGDITWIEIIRYISSFQKPVLLATGASNLEDVKRAMRVLNESNTVLMQCNTNYTADNSNYNYINLKVLETFRKLFPKAVLGLSDHTRSDTTVIAAIALGARVIEKHFTDDNARTGPDHKFSILPEEWKNMVHRAQECFLALGDGIKKIEQNESQTVSIQRRCIFSAVNIRAGETIQQEMLEYLRPVCANAFLPYEKESLIGKKALNNIKKGDPIKKEDVEIC